MEYRIERISRINLKWLVFLYKSAFNTNQTIDFFTKKFDTNYTGLCNIGYLAFDENEDAAAFYGVFPMLAEIDDKTILCAQSGDTMTHPKHQGKGLFVLLAKKTFELAKEEGIKFVFGFPNNNSFPGFAKKLNWVFYEKIKVIDFKITTFPLAKIAKKIKFLNPFYKFYCNLFLNKKIDFNRFSKLKTDKNSIKYSPEYLNYKSYFKHYFYYDLKNTLVYKIDGLLWIGAVNSNENELKNILRNLKIKCFLLGIDKITYLGSPQNSTMKLFEKFTASKDHYYIGFLNFDASIDVSKITFSSFDIDTF